MEERDPAGHAPSGGTAEDVAGASSFAPPSFGRYQVERLVGEGSMGRVYRAFDPMAHRVVAIKTLKSEYLTTAREEEYLKRFRREAQAAGNLAHPHIITVFDVGPDYFVMELLEGFTLQLLLRQAGRLDLVEALRILGPVAEGLDYAHSKGTIHRDIKPSNIMILADGRPKIMDFGVAHLVSTVITAAGEFLGSPSYMAPEQITASQASARTDLFSLAVVAYEMLTGKKPFEGDTIAATIHQIINSDPPAPSSWNAALPARFDDVFKRALAKDPGVRFPNAMSFVAALGRRSADAARLAAAFPPPRAKGPLPVADVDTHDLSEPAPGGRPRPRVHVPLVLGALAFLAGLGALVIRGSSVTSSSLEPRPGLTGALEISTEPVGARVWLDSAEVGKSPLTLSSLRGGTHAVRLALAGFSSAELSVDLPGGAFPVPLRFTLQPLSAILRIRSEPPEAEVAIDGHPAGATPLEAFSVPPGSHRVEVTRAGLLPWAQTVEARAGDTIPLLARLEGRPALSGRAHLRRLGWVHAGDFLEPGGDVTPPVKISGESALPPEPARKLRLRGTVTLEMIVNERGEPEDLRVVESAGEILDGAALAAVRTWRYTPAEKNGVKVRTRVREQQTFTGA